MTKMNIKKITGSKGFRYGSVAVAFSCVFVAIVLVINIIITALGTKFSLYVDMTNQEFYTVSQASKEQLSGIDTAVEIVFFQKSDKISDNSYLGYVKLLAQEYEKSFDFVEVKFLDLMSQPTASNKYKLSSSDYIYSTTVVVHCPETQKSKIIQQEGFYTFTTDSSGNKTGIYGFNGEKRFTANILQVTSDKKPIALFTTGHDETSSVSLYNLLSEEGYEVGLIDLTTHEIPEDTQLLIISNPTRDFAGLAAENNGGTNEIRAINNYLANGYGNVMVFLSPETPELPELSEYLSEWGIGYDSGKVLMDSASNTIDTSNLQIIAGYCGASDSYEYQLHKTASSKSVKMISARSTVLKALDNSAVPVLAASPSCVSVTGDNKTEPCASSPLVLLSSRSRYVNNQEVRSNMLVFSSPYFFNSEYTSTSVYGNAEMLYGAMKLFGNNAVSVDISTKPFGDTSLDITNSTATAMTVVIVAVLPVIILVFGIVVWLRRKSR